MANKYPLTINTSTGTIEEIASGDTLVADSFVGDGSGLTGIDTLPSQTGHNGEYLTTDGTNPSWGSLVIPTTVSSFTNDSGYITGNQTITLSGDVSGSGTTSINVTIADDSHNHTIANVDGLQAALNASGVSEQQIIKAWGEFDDSNNVIDDSFNISSISDTGTGQWRVNFSTAMSNANYAAVFSHNEASDSMEMTPWAQVKATSYMDVWVKREETETFYNRNDISFIVAGDGGPS